jgi:glycosyltransferase involved in cell wall biosynthesis
VDLFPEPLRIALVGNCIPRQCGIATFTHDLFEAVSRSSPGSRCTIVAVNDRPAGYAYPPSVRMQIRQNDRSSHAAAAHRLNGAGTDAVCLQHEFGIYGGPAGGFVVDLLERLEMPVITTLHTVLCDPNPDQRRVMEAIIRLSHSVVVMTATGADILAATHPRSAGKTTVIPHGIPETRLPERDSAKQDLGLGTGPVMLTFGLLGPGKGIEHGIAAMPEILLRHPETTYLVAGATHPHLLEREGETYRRHLEEKAQALGVKDSVRFANHFLSPEEIERMIAAADIYLTPYPNESQVTSGTLARVFGAGKVVVSTPYWHAAELLRDGRGALVPFRDPAAIASAVNELLDDPQRMRRIEMRAVHDSRGSLWSHVGGKYLALLARASREAAPTNSRPTAETNPAHGLPRPCLDHVRRLTDETGILQHAVHNVPNYHEGYCTDDNARALILCALLHDADADPAETHTESLQSRYLAFLAAAYHPANGRFRNFMDHSRRWMETAGSEDSHGRALWALGTGAARCDNDNHRGLCAELMLRALPATNTFTSPRAWAFTLIGIGECLDHGISDTILTDLSNELTRRLLTLWSRNARGKWLWFEDSATYENARLCQALIRSSTHGHGNAALEAGLESLDWLANHQRSTTGNFRPIGSNGFLHRNGFRAHFDQQPVEAQAMVAACTEAWRHTGEKRWLTEARRAWRWFAGENDLGIPLLDAASGTCFDGLHEDRANHNRGAESTLAAQIALTEMTLARTATQTSTPP